jgi:hypothetical protein
MRKLFSRSFVVAALLALAACGGSGEGSEFETPGTGTGPGPGGPAVAAVTVTSDSPTILADGSTTAEITAMVRDANNNLLKDVAVTFTSTSGGVAVSQGTTDASGVAKATLSVAGDPTIRTITVTASVSSISATTTVNVVTPPAPLNPTQLALLTSTPTIPSDGSISADISATVRNANNQFIPGVQVTFASSSGGLVVTQATTDASGVAKATLNAAGDKTNRNLTVTAQAGTINATINVAVTGTRLSVQGPASLALGQTGTYTVTLVDSGDRGIPGTPITVTSLRGNTLSAATMNTDNTGRATFTTNISVPTFPSDTLTIAGLGLTATQAIAVNTDSFSFLTPNTDNAEVILGDIQSLTVRWTSGGVAQVGRTINFSATRGALSAPSAITNASGDATVTISSLNAGGSVISAASGPSTAQRALEFVADDPATIDVQPSVFTIAPAEQSTLTAVVRDPAGNLVKNQTVVFTLSDVTGGSLSTASVVTNSQGRAQTVYTAGSTTSANNGVQITAVVQGTAVQDQVALTVARKEVFISMGTGNSILELNAGTQYQVDYAVQVTDASGNGVPNVPLAVSVLSNTYIKGFREYGLGGADKWVTQTNALCADEDGNRNGVLDATPDEDFNNNGKIDAGNIATVTPRNVTTNANGFALISVVYPQEYAHYVNVTLQAQAAVQGTEFVREAKFLLPILESDIDDEDVKPPGEFSPFGQAVVCQDAD